MAEKEPRTGSSRRSNTVLYVIVALAALVIIVQFIFMAFPRNNGQLASNEETPTLPRPTRTFTATATTVPATNTPTPLPTSTLVPPTATPIPPTATPVPPTETPVPPTETPLPPTETPIPPTPTKRPPPPTQPPPTPAPPPLTVMETIGVNNGEWGSENIYVNRKSEIWISMDDGSKWRPTFGFLSSPEAAAKVQEVWGYAARGSANWKMIVTLRAEQNWTTCVSESNVCYETDINSSQASVGVQLYFQDHVWKSLVNSYLAGGVQGVTSNEYYWEIQNAIFRPMCPHCGDPPAQPCVGISFDRVN